MRNLLNAVTNNASAVITETSGCVLPWLRTIRKAGEYVEQEVDIITAERAAELKALPEV